MGRKSKDSIQDEWGFFVALPEIVLEMAPKIGVDAVVVFAYLRMRTNRDRGEAWPGYDDIQIGTGLRRVRIARALDALEAAGVMSRQKRFGKSTMYRLHPPSVASSSSSTGGLVDQPTVVRQVDSSSSTGGLSVVRQVDGILDSSIQDSQNQDSGTTLRPNGRTRPRDALFDAIAEVCQVDPATAGSSVGKVKAKLCKAEPPYTPAEVKSFGVWWWSGGFRKRPPRIWDLQEQIGVVRNGHVPGAMSKADRDAKMLAEQERFRRLKNGGKP